jgi:hypothetical protein
MKPDFMDDDCDIEGYPIETEEEPHAELKRKYESGGYILIWKETGTSLDNFKHEWHIDSGQAVFPGIEYKLIHKRHKEVLEHWLNGGEVEFEDERSTHAGVWHIDSDFVGKYYEYDNYRIKQDQQQSQKPTPIKTPESGKLYYILNLCGDHVPMRYLSSVGDDQELFKKCLLFESVEDADAARDYVINILKEKVK